MTKDQIKGILKRLDRLEKAVFSTDKKFESPAKDAENKFSGPKGGILLLLSKNYFNKERTIKEVTSKLNEMDYHYSSTVIQTSLRRLSRSKGPLVVLPGEGLKVYAIRK